MNGTLGSASSLQTLDDLEMDAADKNNINVVVRSEYEFEPTFSLNSCPNQFVSQCQFCITGV